MSVLSPRAIEPAVDIERSSPAPLRVCLVTEASGGGVGRHFLDLAAGLAEAGVSVTGIYSPRRTDAQFLERRASLANVRLVELPMRRGIHPLDAASLWQLTSLLRKLGPFDIIHAHSSKAGALARRAARSLRTPSIYTPHAFVTLDPNLAGWKRNIYGSIERWLARQGSAIIAVAEEEVEHARQLGIDPHCVHRVHNGIEPLKLRQRDEVRASLGLTNDTVVIGFIGRLMPQKAPELLLEAVAKMVRAGEKRVRVVMIGSGPLNAEVERMVQQYELTHYVQLLGDRVATEWLPAFDLLCMPSRYEGMPYVLLEALAAGLPIVATAVGGVSTCVTPDRNGLIVPVGDADALAEALARVVNNAAWREELAAESRRRAGDFTIKKMVADTMQVYRHVLASVAAPAGR